MPVTRELTITYGSLTFGGSGARQIEGWSLYENDYEKSAFEFSFVTTAATEAAFATEVAALEDGLRIPRQDLTVAQGSSTILSLKQSDNTGLDAFPSIVKQGDIADTGRSRFYKIRIEFQRPADNVSSSGRRYHTLNVEYDSARRRTLTISGTWTAYTGNSSSFTNYRNNIDALATTLEQQIDSTATWERIGEPQVELNTTDKILSFQAQYREILQNQSSGNLDDANIVDPVLIITRRKESPGDSDSPKLVITQGWIGIERGEGTVDTVALVNFSFGVLSQGQVQRPVTLDVTYTCSIDQTKTKALRSFWDSTIRPFIVTTVGTVSQAAVTLVEEEPGFDHYGNRINAKMTFLAFPSRLLRQKVTVEDKTSTGLVFVPIWTGNPFDYYEYPGPATRQRIYTEEREEITNYETSDAYVDSLVKFGLGVAGISDSQNWAVVSRGPKAAVMRQGLSGATVVRRAEVVMETVLQYRRRKAPSVANAGGILGAAFTP